MPDTTDFVNKIRSYGGDDRKEATPMMAELSIPVVLNSTSVDNVPVRHGYNNTDAIREVVLPKGCIVLGFSVKSPGVGASSIFTLGSEANSSLFISSTTALGAAGTFHPVNGVHVLDSIVSGGTGLAVNTPLFSSCALAGSSNVIGSLICRMFDDAGPGGR